MLLPEFARKLLTIVMPLGFYQYCVLPIGFSSATDKFQARMVNVFTPMLKQERPNPSINDILHTEGTHFDKHLHILDGILWKLEQAGV